MFSRDNEPIETISGQPLTQRIAHTAVTAILPERLSRGVYANALMVQQTKQEFILDFLSTCAPPNQVVARIIVSASTMRNVIYILDSQLKQFENEYGRLLPRRSVRSATGINDGLLTAERLAQPLGTSASITDGMGSDNRGTDGMGVSQLPDDLALIYEKAKIADDVLSGAYATAVLVAYMAEEFAIDFIAETYPRSTVTARVIMAAGRMPAILNTLRHATSEQNFA